MENKEKDKLWEILVPRCSNEGLEYQIEYHREWDEKVRQITKGLTIQKTVKGQWISPINELFIEEMIPVRVYCNEDNIEKIIDYTIEHYQQEAIFAYEISSNVKLKYKEDIEIGD